MQNSEGKGKYSFAISLHIYWFHFMQNNEEPTDYWFYVQQFFLGLRNVNEMTFYFSEFFLTLLAK